MTDLLIFPFGGNAKEAIAVVEAINRVQPTWNLLGFVDDDSARLGQGVAGCSVLGNREMFKKFKTAKILAVPGNPENYQQREKVIHSLGLAKERVATLIDPSAQIGPGVSIGVNTLIMGGVHITANVRIGDHCVLRPNSVISHDSEIHDYCLVGSNVSISGNVILSKLCYIGAGAQIIEKVNIAEGTMVGMGSIVLSSTSPYSVVVGNPARNLKDSK